MRLLLVEDDAPLADGLSKALRQSGYAVDWMPDGNAADTALLTQDFDLAILDLNLPGHDGFEVLRRLRARGKTFPVLILSAREETGDRVRGLDLGADDYLAKPFDLPELEARLRALIRRSGGHAGARLQLGRLCLDTVARRARVDEAPLELTAREYGLLEVLVLRAGHVVSKQQLMDSLCEWDSDMSTNALDIALHRLRRKLEETRVVIRTLRGFGYLLEESHGA